MLSVVIGLQTAAQKAIFSTQPRRSTIESAEHVFLFVNTVRPRVCSYQRSTLAYMELSPAELRSLDVTGRSTSEH